MVPPERKRTTIRSFRVDESALEIVEKDAQLRKISVNTLVNQLLLSYANFDRYFSQDPMIKISSNAFGFLLEGVSDQYASESGKRIGENLVKFHILSKRGVLNLDSVLDHFRMISEYSNLYSYKEVEANGKTTLTLHHRYGRNGSLYFSQYLISIFGMINVRPKVTTTEQSVTIML